MQSHLNKLLRQFEEGTIITNPNERSRTFWRKLVYRVASAIEKIRYLFQRAGS